MLCFLLGATVLAAIAAWTDWRTGHIPNPITGLGLVAAISAHFVRGAMLGGLATGAEQAGLAIGGALFCALAPLFMFHKGAMGGGDVKLFAALGAALHPLAGLEAETYSFVAAACLAPAHLVAEGKLLATLASTASLALNPLRPQAKRRNVPAEMKTWFRLGPAIFLGTLATLVVHVFSMRSVP